MPEKTIHSTLHDTFPPTNKENWKKIAAQEIDGKDPFENLLWKNSDGIVFFPYYDSADVASLQYLQHFQLKPAQEIYSGPRKWINAPQITVTQPADANKIALDHLANGADGVYFIVNSQTDINTLLHAIEWKYCSLFFQSSVPDFFAQLKKCCVENNFDLKNLTGALFWDALPKKNELNFFLKETTALKAYGIVVPPSSPATEIATALSNAVKSIESLKVQGLEVEKILSAIAFSVSTSTHFLETIAKFKALRILWYQVTQAYGIKNYKTTDLLIHAYSTAWTEAAFEPHGNLIKSTSAAMASLMGGCDALTILPQDETASTQNRIARNVSSLLREESHLNKVADPMAGSYAVDKMVDEIAKKAWSLFQNAVQS